MAESLRNDSTLSHYRIISKIGEGGMGEVYLARDTKLDRNVAIKVLTAEIARNESNLQRFIQEAKAASALNHPNILVIYEIGETETEHYIVSEYIEGRTLRALSKEKNLPLSEIIDISVQIAGALGAAHGANIIHRDVKPENIMVRSDGYVKILDFGLAKLVEQNKRSFIGLEDETARQNDTARGIIMGTVNYMSPEQAKGERVDARTDIFSLGVVIYEMIAGRTPFGGDSLPDTFANLKHKEPQPLPRYAPNVPDDFQRIVAKTLRKNKDDRYQTMKGLLADLRELKENLAFDEKLERSKPPGENETAILQVTTGNTNKQTAETQHSFSQKIKNHKPLAAFALAAVLVAAIGFGYWYFGKQAATPQVKSLAVLPLKSLDAGENYLGLGIADAVIRRINQTGELIVRPTSAVRRYLNEDTDALTAARQLNADAVLEGSVQRADDRLRVSVNLLRTSDGTSLWAESFDMRGADIFTIQDSISQQVASRLQLKLSAEQQARLGERYTSNPEAYEYYVKGRTNFERVTTSIGDRQAIDAAIGYFKKAVELDPKYALAYAELGYAYMWMANFNDPDNPVWVGLSQEALSHAESLDPQLAEIHDGRFQYYFSKYGNWDLAQGAREARQALALNPSVGHGALGTIYDHLGLDEATGLREFQRTLETDPTNTGAQGRLIESYELYGKFDDAIDASRRFFGVPPPFSLIAKGRLDEAQPLVEEAVKKNSGDLRARGRLALIFALRGKFQEAEAAIPPILEQARNNRAYHHITYDIACVYALSGKTDEAIKWLRTTADTGMPNYSLFERDPCLNRIRQAPEFIQFMAEMKAQNERYRGEFAPTP